MNDRALNEAIKTAHHCASSSLSNSEIRRVALEHWRTLLAEQERRATERASAEEVEPCRPTYEIARPAQTGKQQDLP
jgi:hypothetical protein